MITFNKNIKEKVNNFRKLAGVIFNKLKTFIKKWGQTIINILLLALLIGSIITTKNLSKQVNDISNKYDSIVASMNSQDTTESDTDENNTDVSSKDESTSSKQTSSKSSKTTNSNSSTTNSTTDSSSSSTTSSSNTYLGTSTDLDLLAIVIFQETGGNSHCDTCRRRVADVVLNRVASSKYPNTIKGVLTQKGQYGRLYYTGIKWPSRATKAGEKKAVERAYRIAEEVLNGQHSELYGKGYIYQAGFKQGTSNIYCCGHYFGK